MHRLCLAYWASGFYVLLSINVFIKVFSVRDVSAFTLHLVYLDRGSSNLYVSVCVLVYMASWIAGLERLSKFRSPTVSKRGGGGGGGERGRAREKL